MFITNPVYLSILILIYALVGIPVVLSFSPLASLIITLVVFILAFFLILREEEKSVVKILFFTTLAMFSIYSLFTNIRSQVKVDSCYQQEDYAKCASEIGIGDYLNAISK